MNAQGEHGDLVRLKSELLRDTGTGLALPRPEPGLVSANHKHSHLLRVVTELGW